MEKLKRWLYARAKIRNLILAIMVIIPLNTLAFPLLTAQFRSLSGGVSTLDVQFAYFPDQAIQWINNFSSQARSFYLLIEWSADLLFPITYAMLFGLLLAVLLKTSVTEGNAYRNLALLPFFMMAADYSENITISLLLLTYPHFLPVLLSWLAAAASFLKWLFGGLVILSLLISLVLMIRHLFIPDPTKGNSQNG